MPTPSGSTTAPGAHHSMRAEMFSGFAQLRKDDDVVPVTRARTID
jgi:hypothetical protein